MSLPNLNPKICLIQSGNWIIPSRGLTRWSNQAIKYVFSLRIRSETGVEGWLLLLSWSGDGLEHILGDHGVSIVVRVDAVVHQLRAAQVMTSKGLEVVDDVVLRESQLLGDLWDQLRKGVVDHRLLKVADTFDVQRWWDHEVDLWVGVKLHKSLGHLHIVCNVLFFVPVLGLGVIGAQLDDDDVRLRGKSVLVSFSLDVRHVSCSDHASPGLPVVLHFVRFGSNLLLPKRHKPELDQISWLNGITEIKKIRYLLLDLLDFSPSLVHVSLFVHDHGHLV